MKVERLPSGNYRVRKMVNGRNYNANFDHKPTQKEIIQYFAQVLDKPAAKRKYNMTFSEAYTAYIDLKSNILSPATIRGYTGVFNAFPEAFLNTKLIDIDTVIVQKVINDYSKGHSPKTVSNMYGLVSIILKTYMPSTHLTVQLPQKIKQNVYIPTPNEVKSILEEIRGTKYYIPTCLGAMGLRKSEIIAITAADLDDNNVLTINKAIVADKDGNLVLKKTKTTDSTREIFIPDELADMIREQGFAYKGFPDCITRNLKRVQKKLGIQEFPLHKMRHFFVTYAHNELHLSPEQIKSAGGWKNTSTIMETVYQHSMNEEKAKKRLAKKIGSLL